MYYDTISGMKLHLPLLDLPTLLEAGIGFLSKPPIRHISKRVIVRSPSTNIKLFVFGFHVCNKDLSRQDGMTS